MRGLIEDHIIIFAPKTILYEICKEVRSNTNRAICYINSENPKQEWHRVKLHFTNCFYLQGDYLNEKELKRSNVQKAYYVMIFANPTDDYTTYYDNESLLLINSLNSINETNIKNGLEPVPFVFELTNPEMMKFVRKRTQKVFKDLPYIYWPDYVSGNAMISQYIEDLPAAQPKGTDT